MEEAQGRGMNLGTESDSTRTVPAKLNSGGPRSEGDSGGPGKREKQCLVPLPPTACPPPPLSPCAALVTQVGKPRDLTGWPKNQHTNEERG